MQEDNEIFEVVVEEVSVAVAWHQHTFVQAEDDSNE
jgi:hypothetical protein